jgi:hypothetical protein
VKFNVIIFCFILFVYFVKKKKKKDREMKTLSAVCSHQLCFTYAENHICRDSVEHLWNTNL